ncbi:DNA replication licensing factor mcm5 [Yarrowia sp. B02]|nr:DNA replication licensing factor mcm5 [Yarrowia sp. B02]
MSFDTGRVYSTQVLPGDDTRAEDTNVGLTRKYADFIREFYIDGNFIYRDQLQDNILGGILTIEVDIAHVRAYDGDLGQRLADDPTGMLNLFQQAAANVARRLINPYMDETDERLRKEAPDALAKVPYVQVTLKSDASVTQIRDLGSNHVSRLVRVPGIIIGSGSVSNKVKTVSLVCRDCRDTIQIEVTPGFGSLNIPRTCQGPPNPNGEAKNCSLDPYRIQHEKSEFVDQQVLKMQEAPEMVPVGEMPRHVIICADGYLANRVVPGTRIMAIGVYAIYSAQKGKNNNKAGVKGAVAIKSPYIRLVGMTGLDSNNAPVSDGLNPSREVIFSEAEEQQMITLSKEPDLYDKITGSIAPSIYGNTDVKKAIACLLVGGSKKLLPDGMRLRGDINVLLLGDPGTAKSQLLKFVEKVSPIAIYTSGKGSSAAGLTASVQRESGSREFYLEGGAMVLADGGVVCIDEFDKMRDDDRVAIHEAMEQQTISIAKAGITTVLNSRTAVLAAANPIFGRYDDMKSPGENIDFQTTILSRFDMIFLIKDEHNAARDATIAKHVMAIHETGNKTEEEGEIPLDLLKRYISYCRQKVAPVLSDEASERLSGHFVELRRQVAAAERQMGKKSSIPITVRQLEAIVRITEALAKLELQPIATAAHVEEAIRLFSASTMDAVTQGTSGKDTIMEEVSQIDQELRRRLPMGWSTSYSRLVTEFVNTRNHSQEALDRTLHALERSEVIQFRMQRQRVYRVGV